MRTSEYREMKKNGFFTSRELADICSVNRMTVVRMEERGLLMPDCVGETGIRYYSLNGLLQLKHILLLERCGLNTKQIKGLFGDTVNNPGIISQMLDDLIMTITIIDADKDPFTNNKKGKIRDFDIRENLCFIKEFPETSSWDEGFCQFHNAIHEAVSKNLRMVGGAPSIGGRLSDDGELILEKVYVPVAESSESEDLVLVPGMPVIYASWYGDPTGVRDAFKTMVKEADKRGYTPRGDCLAVIMEDYYSIKDFDKEETYLFLMLPVK